MSGSAEGGREQYYPAACQKQSSTRGSDSQPEIAGSNGGAPDRTSVYQAADSGALREPDLFRQRLLRSRDSVASLLWQERLKAESSRSSAPRWIDPKPEPIFAA